MTLSDDIKRPRLRFVEPVPIKHEGEIFFLFRDPQGIAKEDLGVPLHVYQLIAQMDGEHDVAALAAHFKGEFGEEMQTEKIETLIQRLDESFLLDSARFQERRLEILTAYRQAPHRPMRHAGGGYPISPDAFAKAMNAHFTTADGPGDLPVIGSAPTPKMIVAPHIDMDRGSVNYGWAHHALGSGDPPETVVILGVSHAACQHPFIFTRQGFETPLGVIPVETEFLDQWEKGIDFDPYADELNHLGEHSVEFQAVWLKHLFPEASDMRIVPVLCGPMQPDRATCVTERGPAYDQGLAALIEVIRNWPRRVTVIASSDFAHIGPQFGDEKLVDEEMLSAIRKEDVRALDCAAQGDADGFRKTFAPTQNARRVCSVANTHTALSCLDVLNADGHGNLLSYVQSRAETGELCVTHASMSFM